MLPWRRDDVARAEAERPPGPPRSPVPPMTHGRPRMREDAVVEFGRVVAFSDGVLSIAITLLVLNIDVPTGPADQMLATLTDNWRQYVAFALSFAIIGRFWILHHRLFEMASGFDRSLLIMNLGWLALIVLIPFTTNLLTDYPSEPVSAACYGAGIGLASLLHWGMVHHLMRAGLINEGTRTAAEITASFRALMPSVLFLLSVPVAFLSVDAAHVVWFATFLPGMRPRVRA